MFGHIVTGSSNISGHREVSFDVFPNQEESRRDIKGPEHIQDRGSGNGVGPVIKCEGDFGFSSGGPPEDPLGQLRAELL